MTNILKTTVLVAVIASAAGVAVAQSSGSMMGSHKAGSSQGMMRAEQMMTTCERMMKAMRSDPVLMKRMNQIMNKMNGPHS